MRYFLFYSRFPAFCLCLFMMGGFSLVRAQTCLKPNCYLISFTDKQDSPYDIIAPEKFLSQRALARKSRLGIDPDSGDLPVSPAYLDSLKKMGCEVLLKSRWFNSVVVRIFDPDGLNRVMNLPFVDRMALHYPRSSAGGVLSRRFPAASRVISGQEVFDGMNASWLHEEGFLGDSMWIAVIDGGFYHVDRLAAFDCLRQEGRLIALRDFVNPEGDLFEEDSHGMQVLSILAGSDEGTLRGAAPRASFILLRSEETGNAWDTTPPESWFEEEAWISAIEYADSIGADVVSSSLGYNVFNDSVQNHRYSDLDGKSLRIARAAGYAVEKGMLVVVSAGNEGNKDWQHIITPGDSPRVLTVGAVNRDGEPSGFTSRGMMSSFRVKPDISALGESVPLLDESGALSQGAGTSFATPLVAGIATCLWQKFPSFSPGEIMEAIRRSASGAQAPDSLKGYGIPDLKKAADLLSAFDESL